MNQNQFNGQNTIIPNNLNPVNPTNQTNNINSVNINNQSSQQDNRFINNNGAINTEITDLGDSINNQPQDDRISINDMNIKDNYNNINKPEYVNDPQVIENMTNHQKKTIVITKELKTVIIITVILLVFILIMPFLFDLISNIRFH